MENFTAKDISVIIKSCKDSGVSSLDYGGLKLSFRSEEPEAESEPDLPILSPIDIAEDEGLADRQVEENQELRDLELQNLMISDPVGFEQHMRYEDGAS